MVSAPDSLSIGTEGRRRPGRFGHGGGQEGLLEGKNLEFAGLWRKVGIKVVGVLARGRRRFGPRPRGGGRVVE